MINIAIVEDDRHYAETLVKYLTRYEEEFMCKFNMIQFQDGEDIVTDYTGQYDIILMDIEMTFMNGMDAAEKIRELDTKVIIIFITNMPQYAIKGYAVDALDFILKPINYYAFSQRIERALKRMDRRVKRFISLNVRGGVVKIDEDVIYFIESQNHNLTFHTSEGQYISRVTLREMEEQLDPKKFFRASKSYLINLEYVTECRDKDVVVANQALQVSRLKKKPLLDALNHYMNEVSK